MNNRMKRAIANRNLRRGQVSRGDATLADLQRETELSRCQSCGEPYDLAPCNADHARIQQDRLRVTPALGVSLKAVLAGVNTKRTEEQ